ncbi:MAG TPA: DEAD/DEAH box helicase, partial [Deltaproteobacteria bacterium]|nr:DEAD/DEAH box helicase [Deltaproteobacteria bacterium]
MHYLGIDPSGVCSQMNQVKHQVRNTSQNVPAAGLLQATWTNSGEMFLWCVESDVRSSLVDLPHLDPATIQPVTLKLAVRRRRIVRREIEGCRVGIAALLPALIALPPDADVSDTIHCFSMAAKLALELAAQQRVVPTVIGEEARWTALLSRPRDRSRARALADALPPAGRAEPAGERPLRLRSSEEVVRSFLGAVVDTVYRCRAWPGHSRGWMRAWAEALRDDDATFALRDARWQAMPERIAAWAASADAPAPRVGFVLELPDRGDGSFPMRLIVHAPGDPETCIPMMEAWRAGPTVHINGQAFPRPAEAALRGLARAARLHPPLRVALEGSEPRDLRLDAGDAWMFLDQGRPALEAAGFTVQLPAAFREAGRQRIRARIRLGSPDTGDGSLGDSLSYRWEVLVGDRVLSGEEFAELLAGGEPIVRWRGAWVFLDPAELARLPGELTEPGHLPLPEALRAVFTGQHEGAPVVADEGLAVLLEALRTPPDLAPPPRLEATLRSYQATGFAWLSTLGELGLGALLADDMGLGKTLQLIAHVLQRADSGRHDPRPALVVCPTSVLGNWERELQRFAPALEVLRWHGHDRGDEPLEDVDVVLTTYGLLVRDADLLSEHPWDVVALDEAQSIKNPDSQRARAARRLVARHRVALTGTPVENRLEELWSVMEFLM